MKCFRCQSSDSKVVDSRLTENKTSIRRRRECVKCGNRFTTFEKMQNSNLMVRKNDGSVEDYDRDKILKSLVIACVKRPVEMDEIYEKIQGFEEQWNKEMTIESKEIGNVIMDILKEFDSVAYIRFASVYLDFDYLERFQKEILKLKMK